MEGVSAHIRTVPPMEVTVCMANGLFLVDRPQRLRDGVMRCAEPPAAPQLSNSEQRRKCHKRRRVDGAPEGVADRFPGGRPPRHIPGTLGETEALRVYRRDQLLLLRAPPCTRRRRCGAHSVRVVRQRYAAQPRMFEGDFTV